MSDRIHYYFGVIWGAYIALWLDVKWWSPLVWLGAFILIEVIVFLIGVYARRGAEANED